MSGAVKVDTKTLAYVARCKDCAGLIAADLTGSYDHERDDWDCAEIVRMEVADVRRMKACACDHSACQSDKYDDD